MTEARRIDVQDQAKLSYRKIFELVRSGITHRLLRSTLTMAVILLAVAFFMFSLTESSILNAVNRGVQIEIAEQRSTPLLLAHLTATPTSLQFSARLARMAGDDAVGRSELEAVTGLDRPVLDALIQRAIAEQRYLRFFSQVSPGQRIALVDRRRGREILRDLNEPAMWERFETQLDTMPQVRLPGDIERLRVFVATYADYRTELDAAHTAWNEAVHSLRSAFQSLHGDQAMEVWLAEADDAAFAAWTEAIIEHGFKPSPQVLESVRPDLAISRRLAEIRLALQTNEVREEWLRLFRFRPQMEDMLDRLDDPRVYRDLLGGRYTVEEMRAVMESRAYERHLADLETSLASVIGEHRNEDQLLTDRQIFLLAISFVVCMVGIANAMLMAITERFREIATMKCLGATDHFILIQFMMEAGLQGIAGGVLGMIIGFIMTMLKMMFFYGTYPLAYFPIGAVMVCAVVSLLTGVVLSIVASIYPSFSASRMAPMDAMRVE